LIIVISKYWESEKGIEVYLTLDSKVRQGAKDGENEGQVELVHLFLPSWQSEFE
jgi:hypothetical protein